MRLGELMVEGEMLNRQELETGLARQRSSGLRLGSTLMEMGTLTSDEVARALARQLRVPAALDRHIAGRDPSLVARLPAPLARTLWALPVAMSRGGDGLNLVVCLRDPTAEIIDEVRSAAGVPVIACVASELTLRRALDASYPPPAPTAGGSVGGSAGGSAGGSDGSIDIDVEEPSQPFPTLSDLGTMDLVELDDQYVNKDHSQTSTGTTGAQPAISAFAGKRQTASNPAIKIPPDEPEAKKPSRPPPSLEDTVVAIHTSTTGDAISQLAIDYLRGQWKGGLVLVVKEKMALGQHGFGGGITESNVESIVVPLDQPSVLRTAHDDRRPCAGDAPIGSTAQDRFLRLFADIGSRTMVVSPVLVRERPVCLLFGVGPLGQLPEAAASVAALAHTMGEAYLRIILAGRKKH